MNIQRSRRRQLTIGAQRWLIAQQTRGSMVCEICSWSRVCGLTHICFVGDIGAQLLTISIDKEQQRRENEGTINCHVGSQCTCFFHRATGSHMVTPTISLDDRLPFEPATAMHQSQTL
jgi:hypothetical protein